MLCCAEGRVSLLSSGRERHLCHPSSARPHTVQMSWRKHQCKAAPHPLALAAIIPSRGGITPSPRVRARRVGPLSRLGLPAHQAVRAGPRGGGAIFCSLLRGFCGTQRKARRPLAGDETGPLHALRYWRRVRLSRPFSRIGYSQQAAFRSQRKECAFRFMHGPPRDWCNTSAVVADTATHSARLASSRAASVNGDGGMRRRSFLPTAHICPPQAVTTPPLV